MSRKFKYLDTGLSGYWVKRQDPKMVAQVLKLNYVLTFIIISLLGVKILTNLSLLTFSLLLIAITSLIFLELNLRKYPHFIIPLSQLSLILLISYLQLIISKTSVIILYPSLFDLFLSLFVTLKLFLQLFYFRRYLYDSEALIPKTDINKQFLKSFIDQLRLAEPLLDHEFEEPTRSELTDFLLQILRVIIFMILLLTPLGLFLFLRVIIYPYIILVPTVLISLFLLVIHNRQES